MRRFAFTFLLVALLSNALHAEDTLKSGPQPGESLPSSFEPLVVTGEHAGDNHCLVCQNGLDPCVMIFARTPSESVLKLLGRIDAACTKHRLNSLGSFAVFLSKDESLDKQLTAAASKQNLKHLILSIDAPEGPAGYKVAKDADVTVVIYTKHKVSANHALKKDELTDAAMDKIIADIATMLSKK